MSEEQHEPIEVGTDYMNKIKASHGSNRDTHGLGTMNQGRFSIGNVDAINGKDGSEVPDFVPTRHELKQLVMYWLHERINHDFEWFAYQQTGSSEWRWSVFISRRLYRLAKILGEEMMQQVHKDAVDSYRQRYPKISDEDWRVFTAGTDEEQEAWRRRLWDQIFPGWNRKTNDHALVRIRPFALARVYNISATDTAKEIFMSIDNFFWAPAGVRSSRSIRYRKYKSFREMIEAEKPVAMPHQVFLAHGGNCLTDEQYFFETADDAQWFWQSGFERMLYVDHEGASISFDRMTLWIDNREVANRGYPVVGDQKDGGEGIVENEADGAQAEPGEFDRPGWDEL